MAIAANPCSLTTSCIHPCWQFFEKRTAGRHGGVLLRKSNTRVFDFRSKVRRSSVGRHRLQGRGTHVRPRRRELKNPTEGVFQ